MRRRLEQLRALAPWERRMLARLVFLLPSVGVSLRLLGFKRTRNLLERFSPPPTQKRLNETSLCENANGIARLVGIAANHGPYHATCLRQSLALWWLLRRRGIDVDLRLGIRKDRGDMNAHAWVEHRGRPLNDLSAAAYVPFDPPFPRRPQSQP